jgi:hypothetical protein
MNDPAADDRRRLDQLLGYGPDSALIPSEATGVQSPLDAEWTAEFEDPVLGVRISVWFIRDPHSRAEAAAALRAQPDGPPAAMVAMNGGMLFSGTVPAGGGDAAEMRLRELASRFAGRE